MSTTDEYSDSSFDNYISKVVESGVMDYLEQKSILQLKLRELEEKQVAHASQGKDRVAHDSQGTGDIVGATEDTKEVAQALGGGLVSQKKTVEDSIKQIDHTLLRIEASILQLQINVKNIQIKQKDKGVSNVNRKEEVSIVYLE